MSTQIKNDPEPERYYDWMLWKMRQEDKVIFNGEVLDQLMYVTAEECGELVQSCMKIARFGMDDAKRNTLLEEAGDVHCLIQLFINNNVFTKQELEAQAQVKFEKLKKYTPIITEGKYND